MEKLLRPVIESLGRLNVRVRYFIADSKARVVLLAMIAITGYYGCQFCMARGITNDVPMLDEHGNRNRRGASVLWPHETIGAPRRTHDMYLEQGREAIEQQAPVYGVKGLSCITEIIPDVMTGVPIDIFHCTYLGLSKKIVMELFGISSVFRPRPENRLVRQNVDQRYPTVRVPSEVQRRPRKVDESSFKASEWKMLTLVAFPILSTALVAVGLRAEARALILYVFLMRSMMQHNDQYAIIKQRVNLHEVMSRFVRAYTHAFGRGACVPSIHLFSHLIEQRDRDYLSHTSSEIFESYYGLVKKAYVKGTPSITKQIIENVLGHYLGEKDHNCKKSFRYRPQGEDVKDDSLIWTNHGYLRITRRMDDGRLMCQRLETRRYIPDVVRNLPFDLVGIERLMRATPERIRISAEEILAKAVQVENYIVTLPFDSLYG